MNYRTYVISRNFSVLRLTTSRSLSLKLYYLKIIYTRTKFIIFRLCTIEILIRLLNIIQLDSFICSNSIFPNFNLFKEFQYYCYSNDVTANL